MRDGVVGISRAQRSADVSGVCSSRTSRRRRRSHAAVPTLAEQADRQIAVDARPHDGTLGTVWFGPKLTIDVRFAGFGALAVRLEITTGARLGDRDVDHDGKHVGRRQAGIPP